MKYTKTQIECLEQSVEKWEKICYYHGADNGAIDCACCKEYRLVTDFPHEIICDGCPIAEAVCTYGCSETPYKKWHKHHLNVHLSGWRTSIVDGCKECHQLAMEELNFLKTLLKKAKGGGNDLSEM